jgi:hypothetical protein
MALSVIDMTSDATDANKPSLSQAIAEWKT